ncbi:uncharacterized protein RHOBADRAFT_54272 [Rhodotorula graminis WP1]|uniref:Uncharacterized protein n=1 Tax=Rhodotorula graminis (strain WP1) TaxID=578459 RepID=A0A194S1P4_RHOGW|nr:uncharacterized protein RHOBADRAFT_54272 [Rhodotorula graminis WP1]KPV74455.1 hypothetical protein RHOBADRAFT_54272 [Rhodotorula graminis WP1]
MPPTIDLFVTSILSNPAIRGRHERVRRGLTSLRIAYCEHDVAADEAAKSLWKRKARNGNELPFLLVDGEPVGSVEEFDDAVEFGELRQFLRLDAAPSAVPPQASSAESTAAPAGAETSSGSTASSTKPSIDDFASLSLSPSELDELAREIASGSTFSSGLGTLTPLDAPRAAPLNFSHATRTIEPVLPSTAPLKFERVNFQRPLPDRPLASDVARDELEGIETDDLGEDELDKLARELEEEEDERRRLRDAQGEARIEPPPLPEKPAATDEPVIAAKVADPPVPLKLPAELAGATAVGGAGGAALSAPLVDVTTLRLSPHEQATLADMPSPSGATLEVQPVSALERAGPLPEAAEEEGEPGRAAAGSSRTSKREADEIRAELNLEGAMGGPAKVSEMPHFGAQDLSPSPSQQQQQEGSDELVENVAAAIRGGDL